MRVNVNLKQHDICMGLDVPDSVSSQPKGYGARAEQAQIDLRKSLNRVLLNHIDFKARIQPDITQDDAFHKQCAAEVNAICLFFPNIWSESLLIPFAAWLGFACVMDDTLETFSPAIVREVLYECIDIMNFASNRSRVPAVDQRVQQMTGTLRDHSSRHLTPACARAFAGAVCNVFEAHIDESRFLEGLLSRDISTYMSIRCRTISLNPFFEVIKAKYLTHDTLLHPIWHKLQHAVSCAAGLQNDLIGLERDIENGEELNAVTVLLRDYHLADDESDEVALTKQIDNVIEDHNNSVAQARELAVIAVQMGQKLRSSPVAGVVEHITLVARTHLMWCATAKRYQTRVGDMVRRAQ